jgi:hypothetical protein
VRMMRTVLTRDGSGPCVKRLDRFDQARDRRVVIECGRSSRQTRNIHAQIANSNCVKTDLDTRGCNDANTFDGRRRNDAMRDPPSLTDRAPTQQPLRNAHTKKYAHMHILLVVLIQPHASGGARKYRPSLDTRAPAVHLQTGLHCDIHPFHPR